ncbi:MAG: GNAT family N-acetyltransferase, partial [Gemmatimonadales bacterium]|nr:GNAT family N-acetyltransferase [Gemmatimonadales bacterium]
YGASGLLRSVAVDPAWRGRGLARKLTAHAIDAARTLGIDDIYLLTTTAEDYFPRLGFEPIAREAVPAGVRESVEFKGACPASAAAMRLGKGRADA